jgi:molecular chaperone HscB
MNYFEVFGLPRALGVDLKDLEKRFHQLSRQHHPDFFTTAAAGEKEQALRMTALLNDAYRTLRHPTQRVEYLLSLEGFKPDGSKVPKSLLMEVFEINEQVEEIKSGSVSAAEIESVRRQIQQKRDQFDAELEVAAREWDRLLAANAPESERTQQLAKLTEILSESSYIRNLERELTTSCPEL